MEVKILAKKIDHTILKADAQIDQIKTLCKEALEYEFASVCVNSSWVVECYKALSNSGVKVCSVVGFPLGAVNSSSKAFETKFACENGASEVDMVMNIGQAKIGNWSYVQEDIEAVVTEAKKYSAVVKVILETSFLSLSEIKTACEICMAAKADFVKTSTGFSSAGASLEHVQLMKETVKDNLKVKASGGIRDLKTALSMINAGADRLGLSAGVSIIQELKGESISTKENGDY